LEAAAEGQEKVDRQQAQRDGEMLGDRPEREEARVRRVHDCQRAREEGQRAAAREQPHDEEVDERALGEHRASLHQVQGLEGPAREVRESVRRKEDGAIREYHREAPALGSPVEALPLLERRTDRQTERRPQRDDQHEQAGDRQDVVGRGQGSAGASLHRRRRAGGRRYRKPWMPARMAH
jgi:hypothetical protein